MRKVGAVSHGKASVIWWANHCAVGFAVTPVHKMFLRPTPSMTNANRLSKVSVGTTKKSTAAIPSA
jgi:hypothetical protein